MIDESKNVQTIPTASAVGACPTIIQIVGRPGTGSLPSTITLTDHPAGGLKLISRNINSTMGKKLDLMAFFLSSPTSCCGYSGNEN